MNPNLIYGSIFNRIDCNMGGNAKSYKQLANIRNHQSYMFWLNQLAEIALSRYDIEGLPETCDKRIVKLSLLWGCTCGFIETETGIKSLAAHPGPYITEYGYSLDGNAYARNGEIYPLKLFVPGVPDYFPEPGPGEYKAVIVYENFYGVPFSEKLLEMTAVISDTWRKLETARKNAAAPYVLGSDESGVNSVKRSLQKRDNNEEAIVVDFGFNIAKGGYFPIQDAMKGLDAFETHLQNRLNQYYALCGIDSNPVIKKKERVNSSEIDVNEDSTAANIDETMEALEYYFEFANKCLGTNMRPVRRKVKQDDAVQGLDTDAAGNDLGDS